VTAAARVPATLLGATAIFAVAFMAAAFVARPLQAGPISFDSATSVIHFQRIVAGQHLEAFITTTPKPLLTLVYGSMHAAFADWRLISWAAIGAGAMAIALTSLLAARVSGPVGGAFVAAALVASPSLFAEVDLATAIPWALLGWAAAGLALTARRPHYALAGIALLVAGTARLETLILVSLAGGALITLWLLGHHGKRRLVPQGAWWILLGGLALPVLLAHDWLLTGDPFFWASVAVRGSAQVPDAIIDPLQLGVVLGERYWAMVGLVALAAVGALALVRDRQWVIGLGLIGLGPGTAALLAWLATRGIYISNRYMVPIDLAVIFTAGVGVAGSWRWLTHSMASSSRWSRVIPAVGAALAIALALVAGWPPVFLDTHARNEANQLVRMALDADRALPPMESELQATPGSRDVNGRTTVLVPTLMRPRMAVDLALPLTRINGSSAAAMAPHTPFLGDIRLAFHDQGAQPEPAWDVLEPRAPTKVADVVLVPLVVDPDRGIWVVRVERPGS
jgi:hypothetical protein